MLFDKTTLTEAPNAVLNAAPIDDAAARLLRHVLKVWAREQGVTEGDVSAFVEGVLQYSAKAILDGRFGRAGA